MTNRTLNKFASIIILIVTATIIFLLTYNNIWATDNISYQFNYANGQRINSVFEIFQSQNAHYLRINGRYVAHWLCQLFLSIIGKCGFSIMNALIFVIYVFAILTYSLGKNYNCRNIFISSLLVLFFCDTEYNPTCQISYIWMYLLVIIFLILFFKKIKSKNYYFIISILLFLYSLLVGNAHESINIGVAGALGIYTLSNLKKVTQSQIIMLIGFGVGVASIILSPATISRSVDQNIPFMYTILTMATSFRASYLLLFCLIYLSLTKRLRLKIFIRDNFFEFDVIFILLIFNIVIGVGNNRQLLGIELFSTILLLRLFRLIRHKLIVTLMLGLSVTIIYTLKFNEVYKTVKTYNNICTILRSNSGGIQFIDIPKFSFFVKPTIKIRFGINLEYVVNTKLREEYNKFVQPKKPFIFLPLNIKEDIAIKQYIVAEYLPGEFIIIQNKSKSHNLKLQRRINLFGLKYNLIPETINTAFSKSFNMSGKDFIVTYITNTSPLIENICVDIID